MFSIVFVTCLVTDCKMSLSAETVVTIVALTQDEKSGSLLTDLRFHVHVRVLWIQY